MSRFHNWPFYFYFRLHFLAMTFNIIQWIILHWMHSVYRSQLCSFSHSSVCIVIWICSSSAWISFSLQAKLCKVFRVLLFFNLFCKHISWHAHFICIFNETIRMYMYRTLVVCAPQYIVWASLCLFFVHLTSNNNSSSWIWSRKKGQ